MITGSIKFCSHMWHCVLSRIWRNLHRDIEIETNRRSEELLKLGGGQKIFIFMVGVRGLPYEGEVRKFSFSGGEGLPTEGGGNFLGGGSYPSAYYGFG